jgi:hypothetical protein
MRTSGIRTIDAFNRRSYLAIKKRRLITRNAAKIDKCGIYSQVL